MHTVAKTAAVTGVSLSMIAGNYAAIPHVALADDAPRSPFSEYVELVQKFSTLKLDQQDRSRLRNEIADVKKVYKESIKSPFRKYADAVQEYANTGRLAGEQLAEVRKHVEETKNAWIAEKNSQQNAGINNVPAAQDPADNNKVSDQAKKNEESQFASETFDKKSVTDFKAENAAPEAKNVESTKADDKGAEAVNPKKEVSADKKSEDKKSSGKHVKNASPKTSDLFGISGLLGSVAGLVTLGAGFVARKRF